MTKTDLVLETSVYIPFNNHVRLLAAEYLIGYFAVFRYLRMGNMGQAIYMEGKGVRDFDAETLGKDRVEDLGVDGRFIPRYILKGKNARSVPVYKVVQI